MSTKSIRAGLLAALGAWFLAPGIAGAQNGALTVAFATGGRIRIDSLDPHNKGWLELYRHIPENAPFVQEFRLDYLPTDRNELYRAVVRQPGERDQGAWIRGTAPGKWDAQVRWDRIIHTFSSTSRMLGTQPSRGVFVLPVPRPDTATWNRDAVYLDPTRTQWDPVRVAFSVTPQENLSSKVEYTWIHKSGGRPQGMSFGSPGSNFREIIEPINQTVQGLRLTQGYAHRRFQAVVSYDLSIFTNDFVGVIADNPLVTTSSASSGSSRGNTSLPPKNLAHTGAATASVSLPSHTRFTGTVTLSWRKQNQTFLPPTINTAITVPNLSGFPTSLHGDVRTALFNLSGSSRPMKQLSLAGRLRYFKQRDHTEEITIPAHVVNDRTLSTVPDTREPFPFAKTNSEVSATWRFGMPVSLIGSWNFERWERARIVRNARHTNEHGARVALVSNPVDWAQFRASYNKSWRRVVGEYLQSAEDQPEGFRRFDQSDRDRYKWEIQADLSPIDQVSFGGILITGRSDYPDAVYGLQLDKNFLVGGDLAWSPTARLMVGLNYTRETLKTQQRSRYREPTQLVNLTYDWVSNNDDYIDTFGASLSADVTSRIRLGGNFELAKSRLVNKASNPNGPPSGGTTSQNTSALATDWPDITQKWIPAGGWVEYMVRSDWAITARYRYDRFDKVDFRTDGLKPAVGADIYLGDDYRNYRVSFFSVFISYRPRLLRGATGRSAL